MRAKARLHRLGATAIVIAGQSPEGRYYNKVGEGLPFYQGKKDFGERYVDKPTTWTTQVKKEVQAGDVLMSVRAPVGPINFATERSCIGRGLAAIRCGEGLDRDYLFYLLLSKQGEISGKAGAVFASINKAEIEAISIPLPPLPEQRRIVTVLDEAFEGIATAKANAEKNLRNARELFEGYLERVFTKKGEGWKHKTLEEISTTLGRGKSRHRPRNAPHLYGGGYPFIQTGDIRNADHVITEYSQTYTDAGLAQSKLWPRGTVCITIAANIAETAILGFDACFPDSVIGVVANPDEADGEFIEYLIQSFRSHLQLLGKGSAQANINMGTFEHERFPFPPVAKQKLIVAKLDDLRVETQRLEFIYKQKLTVLDALNKSLLHNAFDGAL